MAGCLFLRLEGLSLRAFLLRLRGGSFFRQLRLYQIFYVALKGLGNLVKLVNVTGEPGPHAPILKGPPGDAATLRQLCPAYSLLNAHRAVGLNIKTVSEFLESGDSYGVWGRELENLKTAYNKIERASRRV